MPRAWPFNGRSIAWRPRWRADAPPLCAAACEAIADRVPIDWTGALRRAAGGADRAILENLRGIDALRRAASSRQPLPEHAARAALLRAIVLVATLQIVTSFVLAAVALLSGRALRPSPIPLTLAMSFALASLVLGASATRDARRLQLLGTYICAASAFARAVAGTALPPESFAHDALRGVWLEVFLPACLWQFAAAFPRVSRFARFDVAARRIAAVLWLAGCVVFLIGLAVAIGILDEARVAGVLPNRRSNLFWRVFTVSALAAMLALVVRARRAPDDERARVWRFTAALSLGAAPFLALGTIRTLVPALDRWLVTAAPGDRWWIDAPVVAALALAPLSSTAAVIRDRPFALQAVVRARWRRVAALGWRGVLAGAESSGNVWLARAVARLQLARSAREAALALTDAVSRIAAAKDARVLVADRGHYADATGTLALPADAAVVTILHRAGTAIDLSAESDNLMLLPPADRDWISAHRITLASPIAARDGTLTAMLVCGSARGHGFDARERAVIATLTAAAAAVWDRDRVRSASSEPAYECSGCGIVSVTSSLHCSCRSTAILAALSSIVAGRFQVRRRLGAGAMGIVYESWDAAASRTVALKTLQALGPAEARRLEEEFRLMASLRHEGIACVLGLERWRDTPVLVVEHCPGGSLAGRIARGPLPPPAVIGLGIRLTDALAYIHDRRLLHRDLKPGNIGIAADGSPRLLDFGLAHLLDPGLDALPTAGVAGTRSYLSPEVLRGAPVDPALDLWALAVVLLEAATGAHVFDPALPAWTRRCAAVASVDPGLARVLGRALASAPSARFAAARDFRDALAVLLPLWDRARPPRL
jgi:Protein kinase domain